MYGRLFLLALWAHASAFNIVCYYTSWAQYRSGKGKFLPEHIDPRQCTHISFAYAKPEGTDIVVYDRNDEKLYREIMALKQQSGTVKILIAVGGNAVGSFPFVKIVANEDSRKNFSMNAVKFLRQNRFDGIDVDWEFPTAGGSRDGDREKFTLFLQELFQTFTVEALAIGKDRLLLSAIMSSKKTIIDKAYELDKIPQYVDFLNVMTYDFHGIWNDYARFKAPLYASSKDSGDNIFLNIDWVMNYYVAGGVPKVKLHVGIISFSGTYTINNRTNNKGTLIPAMDAGKPGVFTATLGLLSFYEVCDIITATNVMVQYDPQGYSYLISGDQWVGIEDVRSVTKKACYVKDNFYQGVMFWNLAYDDFSGESCGLGNYPLLNAIQNVGLTGTGCLLSSISGTEIHLPDTWLIFINSLLLWQFIRAYDI